MKFIKALDLVVKLSVILAAMRLVDKFMSKISIAMIEIYTMDLTIEKISKYAGAGTVWLIAVIFVTFVSGKFLKNIKDWFWEEEEE